MVWYHTMLCFARDGTSSRRTSLRVDTHVMAAKATSEERFCRVLRVMVGKGQFGRRLKGKF